MITFSPKIITKDILSALPERSRSIILGRFGLGKDGSRRTLEAIGQEYGITRERVRQIENHGITSLRGSDAYAMHAPAIGELESILAELGSILSERTILEELSAGKNDINHILFLLTVGHPFSHEKEDGYFVSRWHVDEQIAEQVHSAIKILSDSISTDDLIPEEELISTFAKYLRESGVRRYTPEIQQRWLLLARKITRNPLGEWGSVDSKNVRVKSMRDYAYLTLKRHGSPMHFTEVARAIGELFGRQAHPATCHNELIKDQRFVLVGRGLYALSEWGYAPGVVKEVIRDILLKEGPLTRDEIVERVKRERYVKDATIAVNLQNQQFTRTDDGRYSAV